MSVTRMTWDCTTLEEDDLGLPEANFLQYSYKFLNIQRSYFPALLVSFTERFSGMVWVHAVLVQYSLGAIFGRREEQKRREQKASLQGTVLREKAYLVKLLVIKRKELFLRTNRCILCKIHSRLPQGAKGCTGPHFLATILAFINPQQQSCIVNRQKNKFTRC